MCAIVFWMTTPGVGKPNDRLMLFNIISYLTLGFVLCLLLSRL